MVWTPGAPSNRGPDDHAQPRRIIGRGLGAEELGSSRWSSGRHIIQQRETKDRALLISAQGHLEKNSRCPYSSRSGTVFHAATRSVVPAAERVHLARRALGDDRRLPACAAALGNHAWPQSLGASDPRGQPLHGSQQSPLSHRRDRTVWSL